MARNMHKWTAFVLVLVTSVCFMAGYALGTELPAASGDNTQDVPPNGEHPAVLHAEYICQAPEETNAAFEELLENTIRIVRDRLTLFGLSDFDVYRVGEDGLAVEVRGLTLSDEENVPAENGDADNHDPVIPILELIDTPSKLRFVDPTGVTFMEGDMVRSAEYIPAEAEDAYPAAGWIEIGLTDEGAKIFGNYTTIYLGMNICIMLDDAILVNARVNDPITDGICRISGEYTPEEARSLAARIQSGTLQMTLIPTVVELRKDVVPTQETETETPETTEDISWTCPVCGGESAGAFCPWCGAKKPETPAAVICPQCGTEYAPESGYLFCMRCGAKLDSGTAEAQGRAAGGKSGKDAAFSRIMEFLTSWSRNELNGMLEICAPSWQEKQENAKAALFALQQNRTPVGDFTLQNEPMIRENQTITFSFNMLISRNNGQPAKPVMMTIRMLYEDGEWYVDPVSLLTTEIMETPAPEATPIPTPTAAPHVDGNTVLYYNPNGGRLYHLDQNCISIHSKYLPLDGSFRYSQVNDEPYASLGPCSVCGAPLR